MIKVPSKSGIGLLFTSLILVEVSTTVASASSRFPNCSSVDSRFLMVVVGPVFQNLNN